VQISEVTARWSASKGSAQTVNCEIWGGAQKHSLEYNAENLTWRAGVTVIECSCQVISPPPGGKVIQ